MAKQGIIPKNLVTTPLSAYEACTCARSKRKQQRDKPSKNLKQLVYTKFDEKVSVDQQKSPTPGLIALMISFRTKKDTIMP